MANTRKAGFAVSHPLKDSGFGKQFKDAGKSGARYAAILGEEEEAGNKVKIKDLKSSGRNDRRSGKVDSGTRKTGRRRRDRCPFLT